ncbi:hypothetical protein WJX73_007197 [Symbiochloris irregularis]|uniref:5'-nucleotidase n=1 Tax=Symbiochloris irregularis TaxID=706552 RepID=A0AAW1PVG9_9CHLO
MKLAASALLLQRIPRLSYCQRQASSTRVHCMHMSARDQDVKEDSTHVQPGTAPVVRTSLIPPPPPPPSPELPGWSPDVWASSLDPTRRVFCNRSLNMASIKAIGFDMDYTLAQYRPESFEVLAYELTVEKLIEEFDYPAVLKDLEFDWQYMMRGLVIDKVRGNILKVDRHKYVKLAIHGFRVLSRQERLDTYAHSQATFEFDEPDYALIDTLFSLAEAHLFMQLVDLHDAQPDLFPKEKSNADLYRDTRAAVDMCHRDGSLKNAVAKDPAKYIHEDGRLLQLLKSLRASGRGLFLATNSLWDYTNVVMNFLLTGRTGSDRNTDWLQYFDIVITGCAKPAFFTGRRPLYEVMTESGFLRNTDGGTAMIPIGEADLPKNLPSFGSSAPHFVPGRVREQGERARVFQGGSTWDLHKMLGIDSGNQVVYVGDHIYGDILRSKKQLGWRTVLVFPELAAELDILSHNTGVTRKLRHLRLQRDVLEDQIQRLNWALMNDHHARFHSAWGQLLKTGYQNSRFAHQVERFACLYTSHVSNLSFYSPDKSYRGRMDFMAHEEDAPFRSGSPSAELSDFSKCADSEEQPLD